MVVNLAHGRFLARTSGGVANARGVGIITHARTQTSCRVSGRNLGRGSRIRLGRNRGDATQTLLAVRKNPNQIDEIDIDSMCAPGDEPNEVPKPLQPAPEPTPPPMAESPEKKENRKRKKAVLPDSTDAVATFMTRRFGIAGGLAWLGVLTFGVVSEQLKTRREVREAKENTKEVSKKDIVVTTSSTGVQSSDLKIGGGERVQNGYLVAADIVAKVITLNPEGVEYETLTLLDTRKAGRQLVFTFGKPQGPITRGLMESVSEMKQGGRRVVVVPPSMGFGENEQVLQGIVVVPPKSTVRYDIELTRVSVPPS